MLLRGLHFASESTRRLELAGEACDDPLKRLHADSAIRSTPAL